MGLSGSGRTRLLRRVLHALDARGATVLERWPRRFDGARLVATREQADLRSSLPSFLDAARRGRTATHPLLHRLRADAVDGVWVVADDIGGLFAESLMRSVHTKLESGPDRHVRPAATEPLDGCIAGPLEPMPLRNVPCWRTL